jgi:hypothetical protein
MGREAGHREPVARGGREHRATHAWDVAGALRLAQQHLRAQVSAGRHPYEHPYYWAGFVVSSRELPLDEGLVAR